MNYAILATYVRDDNDYIDEWVKHHLSLGFEHIVIYDHHSKIPVVNIWGDKVTLLQWESDSVYRPYYVHNDTLKNFKSYWLALFDVDEFLVLKEHTDVKDLLKNYEYYGCLGIPWSMYGSSGHMTKPEGGVKDNYLWREVDTKMYVKPIINTQYCYNLTDPHGCNSSRVSVNEDFKTYGQSICDSSRNLVKLNHYFTRSFEDWQRKVARGTGHDGTPPRPMSWFDDVNNACTVYDPILKK